MSLPLLAILGLIAMAAGTILGWNRRPTIAVDPKARATLLRMRRRSSAAVMVGILLGIVAAVSLLAADVNDLGRLASLAPELGGIVTLLVVTVAEFSTPHLEGDLRTASLQRRRRVEAVDIPSAWLAVFSIGALVVVLSVGWALGGPDDMGRPGRSLTTLCGSSSPWPGSYYSGLMILAVAVLALATIAAVAAVADRPKLGAISPTTDKRLRRSSTRQVLLVSAATAACSLIPVSGLMSVELMHVACGLSLHEGLSTLLGLMMMIAAVSAAACLGTAIWGPRMVDNADESTVVQ